MPEKLAVPAGLKTRGRRFWRTATSDFDLSKAELELLLEACRVMDTLDALTVTISEMGSMVTGSQGQQVINPALAESRGQQAILHRLIAALDLPDDDGAAVPSVQRLRASKAASKRWAGRRQDGALRVADGTNR